MNGYIKKEDAYNLALNYGRFAMAAIVADMPTIDIIRCGECEYTDRVDDHEIWCTGRGCPCQVVAPDGFCEKGRRKQKHDEFHAIPYTSDWAIQNGYE